MISTMKMSVPLALLLAVLVAMGFLIGVARADAPPTEIEARWSVYNDDVREHESAPDGSGAIYSSGNEMTETADDCTYKTHSDKIHWSSGNTQLSMHGWWTIVPGSSGCPTRADVETMLQGVWCDFRIGACWWKKVNEQEKRVRAGGGAVKRSNARTSCVSTDEASLRSVIDVDLVGMPDPPGKLRCQRVESIATLRSGTSTCNRQ